MKDGKHVILCVDDDQDFLLALEVILEDNGYAMVSAQDGNEAMGVFRDSDPDLVLVDLMMEEVDAGTNFVRELRAAGSTVPVYMISSAGDQLSQSIDPSQLGLSGVLQKPLDKAALLALLRAKLPQ